MDWVTLTGYLITPLCGAVGWIAGTRMRKVSAIKEMQEAINMLAAKNKDYLDELISVKNQLAIVRTENADLKKGQELMTAKLEELRSKDCEIEELRKENARLKEQIRRKKDGKG